MTKRIVAVLAAALLALVACDDDGATVRDLGGSASSGSGSGSGSGTGVASGSGTEPVCEDAGDGGVFRVVLDDFTITPDKGKVVSGPTRFLAINTGEVEHELVIAQAPNVESLPLAGDDGVDEDAMNPGQIVAEVESVGPGEACAVEADLEATAYVLFCNVLDEDKNKNRSHFLRGMRTRLKVS